MEELVLFILCFIIILVLYQIFVVSKAKKNKEKIPMEMKYVINKYRLDMKKISFNQLLQLTSIVSSFDIALVVSISSLTKSFVLQMIVAVLAVIPIILMSYHLVYLFYKKKGMVKNESKRNRK